MPRICPGPMVAFDQFHGYFGSCMEEALSACFAAALLKPGSPGWMNAIVRDMQARGLCTSPNGATTLAACAEFARAMHYGIVLEIDYSEPINADVIALLNQYAGVHPVLLQLANGQALRDDWKGSSDEPTLRYHGIAVLGLEDDGSYACLDGDNPQARLGRFCKYSQATILAARPCGFLVIDSPPAPPEQYTIKEDDCLWGIIGDLHLNTTAGLLYAKNAETLDKEARKHGYPDSNQGSLIFANTVITL